MNNCIIIITLLVAIILAMMARNRQENLRGINVPCNKLLDKGHCPQTCSQFLYPDMYSPLGQKCSNPFSWGFLYSTGRCPHAYANN